MTPSADVIVIGAGIVGAACADELARGGLRVTVVEAGVTGGGTTAAGMGHIVVMDDSEAQFALTHYSARLWGELLAELPAQAEYTASGTLWVAADDEEMVEVRRKHRFYGERGVRTEILDEASLAEAEPNLRKGLAGGLLVPGDGVVYPPWVAGYLVRRSGGHMLRGQVVHAAGRRVRLAGGAELEAGAVVNATGADAGRLTPEIVIQPRKGHLLITDRYPGYVRHQLVELGYLKSAHGHSKESVAFNIQPRATGQMLIGSSRQLGVTDAAVEGPMLSRMLARAIEYLPGLGALRSIRAWTGLRPCTADNLPFIGPSQELEGLYVAAGHEGLGITMALGTGRLIADHVLGRRPEIAAEAYRPGRAHEAGH